VFSFPTEYKTLCEYSVLQYLIARGLLKLIILEFQLSI